jgi:hypothetical protein
VTEPIGISKATLAEIGLLLLITAKLLGVLGIEFVVTVLLIFEFADFP